MDAGGRLRDAPARGAVTIEGLYMFGTANWPEVANGAGLALGLALVVAQLAARAVRLALGNRDQGRGALLW